MTFTYYLLQVPPYLLLFLTISAFAALGGLCTYLCRKFIRLRVLRSHNEVTGNIFACAGGLYSLLLAFVVFLVWDSFNDANQHANVEFGVAKGLYRDIQFYPDTAESRHLKTVYINFIQKVVNEEYPALAELKPVPPDCYEAFNQVFEAVEQTHPDDPNLVNRCSEMFRHLNELSTDRSLRILDGGSWIPFEIWLPLLIGGFITLLFATMLDIENARFHILLTTLLGAFIGMVMYLIVILDYPFSGHMSIQPTGFLDILKWAQGQY
jgi:hypothetical protein